MIEIQSGEGDELVNIDWAHLGSDGQPDLEAAKKAAEEMRVKFLIGTNAVAKPYRSNHNFRQAKAVDMTLVPKWGIGKTVMEGSGDGKTIQVKSDLFRVAQTYGILHFDLRPNKSIPRQDDVHWSRTGA